MQLYIECTMECINKSQESPLIGKAKNNREVAEFLFRHFFVVVALDLF
jgi:hypothetical protein